MQSRQKVSLAGLLEITLTQFVSCCAGDWALWPEYGRRKIICCDTVLVLAGKELISCICYVLGGVVGISPLSTSRARWSLATLATRLWCMAEAKAMALTVFCTHLSLPYEKCMCYMKCSFYSFLMCVFLDASFKECVTAGQ